MNLKRIGLDTSKAVFTLHGVDHDEKAVLRRNMRRAEMEAFFAKLPPTHVVLEACGGSHHWGRRLAGLGHTVQLIPPQYVKPFTQARQERPQRRRCHQRGSVAAGHAERGGAVGRATGRGDRAFGARAAGPATDATGQRRARPCRRVRHRGGQEHLPATGAA